ncbi:hypothetical protein STEG23_001526, partial [Scotinomys teguina]
MWGLGTKSQSSCKSSKCSLQHPSPVQYKYPVLSASLTGFRIDRFLRSGDAAHLSPACLLLFRKHEHSSLEVAAGTVANLPAHSCAPRRWLLSGLSSSVEAFASIAFCLFSCIGSLAIMPVEHIGRGWRGSFWLLSVRACGSNGKDRVSLCSFGAYSGTHSVDQADLELTEICLPLPPEC